MSEISLSCWKAAASSFPQNLKSFNERVLEEVECMCKVLLAKNKLWFLSQLNQIEPKYTVFEVVMEFRDGGRSENWGGGPSLPSSNVMSIIYPLWLRWWQSLTENFHLGKHDVFYYLVFVKIFSTSLYIRFWCFY